MNSKFQTALFLGLAVPGACLFAANNAQQRTLDEGDTISDVQEVPADVKAVFTPKGFDTNDNAELVVSGAYPNSCYRVGRTEVTVDKENKTVDVTVLSNFLSNQFCLQIYVPFTQTLSLGVLDKGDYTVNVNQENRAELPVAKAQGDQVDDFLYANVEGLIRNRQNSFVIEGTLPNDCSYLDEIKVTDERGDVFSVLPITRAFENCTPENVDMEGPEFKAGFSINPASDGLKLIHVRSLNGQSLNRVVSVSADF